MSQLVTLILSSALTGGYNEGELIGAGAYRVFKNRADLRARLGELGLSAEENAS